MAPDRHALEAEVLAFIRARGDVHAAVTVDTDLVDGGLLDSLLLTDLILHLEKTHGFQFEGDDVGPANFSSVAAIAGVVTRRLASAASAR